MNTFRKVLVSLAALVAIIGCDVPADNGGIAVNNYYGNSPDDESGVCEKDADCFPGTCGPSGLCVGPKGDTGANGVNGTDGKDGQDGVGCKVIMDSEGCAVVVCATTKSDPICDGTAGSNGTNGVNGTDGKDGVSCSVKPDAASGCWVVTCGTASSEPICSGKDGTGCTVIVDIYGCAFIQCGSVYSEPICNGEDGSNGTNGVNGTDGKDGVSCSVKPDAASGCWVVTCGTASSEPICSGKDGKPGVDGKDAPTGELCKNSADCDDGDLCTLDFCDQQTSTCHTILFTFCEEPVEYCANIATPCDDGNACTVDDECKAGNVCEPGPALDCDDGNACTVDSCDSVKGCVHQAFTCDDGDPNTTDACDPKVKGGCVFTLITIPAPAQCFGLRFKLPAGASCVGYPAPVPGAVDWTTIGVKPDADGYYSAPVGICSVLCTSKPSICNGQWDGDQEKMDQWYTAGCSHLLWPNGFSTPEPGCTWDALNCVF